MAAWTITAGRLPDRLHDQRKLGRSGGGLYNFGGTATLTDTIVAGNTNLPAPATSTVLPQSPATIT